MFTRRHEDEGTKIRDHQFKDAKVSKCIIGYDASALYLSTMLEEIPCGKEKTFDYTDDAEQTAMRLTQGLKEGKWFGFAEVDIEISEPLWKKFEEIPPFVYNKEVPKSAVLPHILDYLKHTVRKLGDGRKLVGELSEEKLLLYAPLPLWYVEHRAVIKKVHRTINY